MGKGNGKAKGNQAITMSPGRARQIAHLRRGGHSPEFMRSIRPATPALRHGALIKLSETDLAAASAEIFQVAPWLQQPRYSISVELFVRTLARIRVMDRILSEHPRGWAYRATSAGRIEANPGEAHYLRLIETARRSLESLGLTPAAAHALGLDVQSPDPKDIERLLESLPVNPAPSAPVPESSSD